MEENESMTKWSVNFKNMIDSIKPEIVNISKTEEDKIPNIKDLSFLDFVSETYTKAFNGDLEADNKKEIGSEEVDVLLVASILKELSNITGKTKISIIDEAYLLGVKKNHDYGSKNITRFGRKGIYVRIVDKIERIKNLTASNDEPQVKNEKIEDTLKDIINYCFYDIMLKNNVWDE